MLYEKVILFLHFEAYFLASVVNYLYVFFDKGRNFNVTQKITELKGEGKKQLDRKYLSQLD